MNYSKFYEQFKILKISKIFLTCFILSIMVFFVMFSTIHFNIHNRIILMFSILFVIFSIGYIALSFIDYIAHNALELKILYSILRGCKVPLVKKIEYNRNIDKTLDTDTVNIFNTDKKNNFSSLLYVNSYNNIDLVENKIKNFNNSYYIEKAICYKTQIKDDTYKIVVVPKNVFNILVKLEITCNCHNILLSTYTDDFDEDTILGFSNKSFDKSTKYSSSTFVLGIHSISKEDLAKLKLVL